MLANPFIGVNYLDDNSRMAVPPAFVLKRLFDFDAELVVFPSRYVPYAYVLARKRRTAGFADKALAETLTQPDTKLCLTRGLVPVCMLYRMGGTGGWNIDTVIESLTRRDLWAQGGGEKVANTLEANEAAEAAKTKAQTRDDLWMRSGQAWESYKRRTGQRVTSPGMGSERHVPTARSSGSTVGSARVTLT